MVVLLGSHSQLMTVIMALYRPAHPSAICSHSQRAWLEDGREDVNGWRMPYPAIKRVMLFLLLSTGDWHTVCVHMCVCRVLPPLHLFMFRPSSSQSDVSPPSVLTHDLPSLRAACNRGLLSDIFLSWDAGLCRSTAHFSFNAAPLALCQTWKKEV